MSNIHITEVTVYGVLAIMAGTPYTFECRMIMDTKSEIIISQVYRRGRARYEAYQITSNLTLCASEESVQGVITSISKKYNSAYQAETTSRYFYILVLSRPPPRLRAYTRGHHV